MSVVKTPASWSSEVQRRLHEVAEPLVEAGVAVPALEGKLLRPLVALALVPPALRTHLDDRFWRGALALQMVHEASLLHDDILDDADERRGRDTVVARAGVNVALVLGDHYLTGAYRAAAGVGVPAFLERFIVAVERTVAGEILQGRAAGRRLADDEYQAMITGKSGELFGAASALGGALFNLGDLDERVRFGCDLGALYQRVDDLLDYCPAAATGKPPLQDYRHGKWTWLLELAEVPGLGLREEQVLDAVFTPDADGVSAADRAVAAVQEARMELVERAALLAPGDGIIAQILDAWVRAAEDAVQAQAGVHEAVA